MKRKSLQDREVRDLSSDAKWDEGWTNLLRRRNSPEFCQTRIEFFKQFWAGEALLNLGQLKKSHKVSRWARFDGSGSKPQHGKAT